MWLSVGSLPGTKFDAQVSAILRHHCRDIAPPNGRKPAKPRAIFNFGRHF